MLRAGTTWTNREQAAIVDDLYIESIWLLHCPTANRWSEESKNEGGHGETNIYVAL